MGEQLSSTPSARSTSNHPPKPCTVPSCSTTMLSAEVKKKSSAVPLSRVRSRTVTAASEQAGGLQIARGGDEALDLGLEDAGEVEPVDGALPQADAQILVHMAVADGGDAEAEVAGQHVSAGGEVAVAGVDDRFEHQLREAEEAHPLGDDEVVLLVEVEVLHPPAMEADPVAESVVVRDLAGEVDDRRAVDRVHLRGSGARGEHGEDAGARADVEHTLPLGHLLDRARVGVGPGVVLDHQAMHTGVRVAREVVVVAGIAVGHGGRLPDAAPRARGNGAP